MTASSPSRADSPPIHDDVACTVCSCVCDDLRVEVDAAGARPIQGACRLAEAWLAALAAAPALTPAIVEGRPATLGEGVDRAAGILRASKAPLICGLVRSSTEGVRAAVELAERLGGCVDPTASPGDAASILALQSAGESTCTLGEVRHRADLVICWGADPVTTHPRLFERFVDAKGTFISNGRRDRTVIVIGSSASATSELAADEFIQIPPGRDIEVIWALRQILKGVELPGGADVGVPREVLRKLVERMAGAQYGAVFYGKELTQGPAPHANVASLSRLVTELNAKTRFTMRRMSPAGLAGATATLAWLTGFPLAVNFARGYPRYGPGEYAANELLARGEVDACVVVGSERAGEFSPAAQRTLSHVPTIVLDYPHVSPAWDATVRFTTAVYGVHAAGTAYRMDEVALPLRPLTPANYPTDDEVLRAIWARMA
jgi:formylmethanofuran dehydrogenase subunit B